MSIAKSFDQIVEGAPGIGIIMPLSDGVGRAIKPTVQKDFTLPC